MTKKNLNFENFKPLIVLTAICIVVAALLAGVNMLSAPIIEEATKQKAFETLKIVLPNGKNFEEISITDKYPDSVTKAYKADSGYVFETSVTGNKPGLVIMCGIDKDGKIVGVEVVSHDETPSYFEKVSSLVAGTDSKYVGKSQSDINSELISGATNSSNGIYKAVKAAIDAYAVATGGEVTDKPEETPGEPEDIVTPVISRTKEEILELAKAMYDGEVSLEWQYVYQPDPTFISAYKNESDGSYVLYLGTRTQYTPLETEALVLVDKTGTVLRVNLLTWTVGHGVNYTAEYLNSIVGKNKYSTDEVELVSSATGTSNNFVAALEKALRKVFEAVPMTDEEIEKFANRVVTKGETLEKMSLPENTPKTVRAMFKLASNRGYVFYTVTSTEYAKHETEAFIYTDIRGKVLDILIVTWNVGHGVEPSDDYINGIIGKYPDNVKDAELITGATTTSENLRNAVADAISLVPEHTNYSVVGIVVLAFFIGAALTYVAVKVIIRRKRK